MKKGLIAALVTCVAFTNVAFADHHHADEMWDKCDKNKDGFISKDEFMESKTEKFNKADKNSDGKLSKDEHKEMFKKMKDKFDD